MERPVPQPARIAYDSFSHNINMANLRVTELTVGLEGWLNRIPFWGTKRRKRIETDLQEVRGRITDYANAQQGILAGDYTSAVSILRREAERLAHSETPEQTARRVVQEPATLNTILNSPNAIAIRMRRTAQELESLNS